MVDIICYLTNIKMLCADSRSGKSASNLIVFVHIWFLLTLSGHFLIFYWIRYKSNGDLSHDSFHLTLHRWNREMQIDPNTVIINSNIMQFLLDTKGSMQKLTMNTLAWHGFTLNPNFYWDLIFFYASSLNTFMSWM